jgi:Insertion element 4 transposase N-terminal
VEQSVITRTVTVAPGRFAPGHLGELTQQLPFEMVDAALVATGRTQSRLRDLPARVVVYLLVAGCLFAEQGYVQVWQRLCAGLDGLPVATPTASALTHARRRLGPAPLRALFALVCGPAPSTATGGVRIGGLLVCAIDGTTLSVADTPANHGVYTTQPGHHGGSGYPLLRLVALVACGTRSLIEVVFGPTSSGETTMTNQLAEHLHTGMLVLCDRNLTTATLTGRTPAGIDQEVHALLVCYQLLRLAMADATSTQAGIDPDRASFTIALNTARDQLIQAAGVIASTTIDLVGKIGRAVLDNLLADRRLRVSPRVVKRAISKYNARGPNINRTSYKATLSIDILASPTRLTTSAGP